MNGPATAHFLRLSEGSQSDNINTRYYDVDEFPVGD